MSFRSSVASNAARAVLVGGLIAGTLDAAAAFYLYGWGMPRGIASGLLGRGALHGGAGIWALGLALHYFIACLAALTYYLASRKLPFLRESPVICGMFFGIAVFLFMNLIVRPMCAFHATGPIPQDAMRMGLVIHMLLIGLPIALSVRRYSP